MASLLLFGILLVQASSGIVTAAGDIPISAGDFETGKVVTVDSPTLQSLSDPQLRALLQFTGSCGRLLLVDVGIAVEKHFRDKAACDGQFLRSIDSSDNRPDAVSTLEELASPSRASPADLERLLVEMGDNRFEIGKLLVFWVAYLALAILLLINPRTRISALAFSILATLLVAVIWPAATSRSSIVWAEAEADDRRVAFFGIDRASTYQDGSYTSDRVRQRGGFDINPTLGYTINDDEVEVCNHGAGMSTATHVFFRDSLFAIPALQPQQRWLSGNKAKIDIESIASPALRLFQRRSRDRELTILSPLPVVEETSNAWLLHYVAPDQETRSCDR